MPDKKQRARCERVLGKSDQFRITIDHVQFVISLADFKLFSQGVIDCLQSVILEQGQRRV